MKRRATNDDIFTKVVHPILEAARQEGATPETLSAAFFHALAQVYGPSPVQCPPGGHAILAPRQERLLPLSEMKIAQRHRRRLEAAIDAQIREYARYRKLLRYVDAEVFSAGIAMTGSESGLIAWLCEPARALDNKVPLRTMRTNKGRKAVANILRALDHGVYL